MRQALLLAHPAGHSLSPNMHNAAFEARGIDAVYRARDVPPLELAAAVAGLRREEMYGANVTIPHKEAVLKLMDRLSDAAKTIGAVNTITNRGGELVGDNTDAGGFLRALAEGGIPVRDTAALVLGAGGAARAVVYALATGGASTVHVFNRTTERAARLAAELGDLSLIRVVSGPDLGMVGRSVGLLVNATSVGMTGTSSEGDMPCPPDAMPAEGAVVDIVYRPALTPLLVEAARRGLVTQNGVAMLVHQGAAAFEQWTGKSAPVAVMRTALEEGLLERRQE